MAFRIKHIPMLALASPLAFPESFARSVMSTTNSVVRQVSPPRRSGGALRGQGVTGRSILERSPICLGFDQNGCLVLTPLKPVHTEDTGPPSWRLGARGGVACFGRNRLYVGYGTLLQRLAGPYASWVPHPGG